MGNDDDGMSHTGVMRDSSMVLIDGERIPNRLDFSCDEASGLIVM